MLLVEAKLPGGRKGKEKALHAAPEEFGGEASRRMWPVPGRGWSGSQATEALRETRG